MTKGLMGKKLGMMGLWNEQGKYVAVSVIQAGPCHVVQVKSPEKEGYASVQIGFDAVAENKRARLGKPRLQHQKKLVEAKNVAYKNLRELRDLPESKEVGDQIDCSIFTSGEKVHIEATSKGKGFQGVVKRYGFRGGKGSHGSTVHRVPGSIGAGTDPSEVIKGKKMPGRMGGKKVTVMNLEIVKIIPEENLVLIKGAVPGANGSEVFLYQN
ncbi:MAG: 50S ribosomal protein L3 [Leptospiraceae bacterium]|nr:50S ribosomal protein L3 [Leptospiraceae bacterium]